MKDIKRQASIVTTMHPENGLGEPVVDGSRSILFGLKMEILELAKKTGEEVIVCPDEEILLLSRRSGSVVEVPNMDLTALAECLPQPEKNVALASINGSKPQIPITHLFIPNDSGQIFVITPPNDNPLRLAKQTLGSESHDYEVAQQQIIKAQAPLVIARHEIDGDVNPNREDRWVLMQLDDTLYVTSPIKLASGLIDPISFFGLVIDGENALGGSDPKQKAVVAEMLARLGMTMDGKGNLSKLDTQQRAKVVEALVLEAVARSRVLVQPNITSPVERAKAITTPISTEKYQEEIRLKYDRENLSGHFEDELQTQRRGLEEAMAGILNPEEGYEEYLSRNRETQEQKENEYAEGKQRFEADFGNYGAHKCELVDTEDAFECVITEAAEGKIVQIISIEEKLGENQEKLGLQIVWKKSDGEVEEKPADRKYIGPAQKLKALADTKRRGQIEILDYESWKTQSISQSALATGYYTLPYNVRKNVDIATTDISDLFDVVSIHNTDKVLKERSRDIAQWLEHTSDERVTSFIGENGEVSPTILRLKDEYIDYTRRQSELQSLRQELEDQEPVYDKTIFLKLIALDPRKEDDRRKALALYREAGVIVVSGQDPEEISRRFSRVGEFFVNDIDIRQPLKEIRDVYSEPVETQEDYAELLKRLPLTQREYDLLVQEGEGEENLDVLARAALINHKIFWRAHIKSRETDIVPNTSLNQVRTIAQHIMNGEPIPLSIYYACCESTHPFKVTQQVPDISEYYFLRKLEMLSRMTKTVHEPGTRWILVNEATIAGELVGSRPKTVDSFVSDMQGYLAKYSFDSVSIVDMRDVIRRPFDQLRGKNLDLDVVDNHKLQGIWRELTRIGLAEGELDKDRLYELLKDPKLFNRSIATIASKMKVAKHRTDAFATSRFMGDFDLDLSEEQLLSLSGRHIAQVDNFAVGIPEDKVETEVMTKWVKIGTENARFFDSHMQLRPLIKALGKAGIVDLPEALNDETIQATITRKEDKLVISPADNGLFPTHGYGCLTATGRMHVVPAHEILSHPNRYVLATVGERIIAVLDTPDEFVEEQARNAKLSIKDTTTSQSNSVFDSKPN